MQQCDRMSEQTPDAGISSGLSMAGAPSAPATGSAMAARHYGIEATAEPLAGEKDANFRLTTGVGRRFFLKILNPGEAPAVSSMHSQALLHVERRAPDLAVQRIVPTPSGEADFRILVGGETRTVRLTTFTPGRAQKGVPSSPEQARAVGRALARLQEALADFRHPAEEHETAWDMRRAPSLRGVLPMMPDAGERTVLAGVLDAFEGQVLPRLSALPRQVAHNDFNKDNILLDEGDPTRIAGIIDFGDMVMTPVLFDVAVAAAYQLDEKDDPLAPTLDFLRGYSAVRPLSGEEIALLPVAIRTRMAMRLLIPQWRAERFPERADYILRNSPSVSAQFRAFAAYGAGEVEARLDAACRS